MSGNQINANAKYTLSFNSWRFKPTLKLSLCFIILFTILVYLGQWQLHRATYKKNISDIVQHKSQQPPVDFLKLDDPSLARDRFTYVSFTAKLLQQYTFLLDNQMHRHQAGYRVVTVAEVAGCKTWLLIDRGWVASGNDRQILPSIHDIPDSKTWIGIINKIPTGIVLQKDQPVTTTKTPWVLQSLDYDLINKLLQHKVFNFVVQLRSSDMTNYIIPELEFGTSSTKHLVYAAQWFLFAALLLVYYLIATIKRDS